MRVLVACECSQKVCAEFRKLGHEAYSCDIQPSYGPIPEYHLQQDVVPLLDLDWDLIIAHPPCTHLTTTGARWFKEKIADGRQKEAIDFFLLFTEAKAPRICIENPVGIMSTIYRKPDQIIQPYMFGNPAKKKTCLWLKGLPKLIPTELVEPEKKNSYGMGEWYYNTSKLPPKERSRARSETFDGIAKAMAQQWGK